MAQVPNNPKLWAMLTAQARAHFRVYPSPAAAHWVHSEYVKKGGAFVNSSKAHPAKHDRRDKRDKRG